MNPRESALGHAAVLALLLLVGLSAMTFFGVARTFDRLAPSIGHDLAWKAQRGALELAQSTQLGMLIADRKVIALASADYARDLDVVKLVALDTRGSRLFEEGSRPVDLDGLLHLPRGVAHDLGPVYAAWAPTEIEGVEAGRIAVFVSKDRLERGMDLRRQILMTAGIGCALAVIACWLLAVPPLLRKRRERRRSSSIS